MSIINFCFKKFIDLFFVLFILIFFFPIFLLIPILIIIIDGSPIMFTQVRAGKDGREFKLYKFKTISNSNQKIKITKLGRFLRITRIDEFPQIFNILKGEISLVGPRPLYTKYIKLYDEEQIKRLTVTPGITGWAQINGENNISWKKKFELDVWYIRNYNIFLDLKIIFLTLIFFIKKIIFYNKNQNNKIIEDEFNGKN